MPRERANPDLVEALRATAARLQAGAEYRWTHMGSCNCGHLAQTVTRLSPAEIHRLALQKPGDWGEQAVEYRPPTEYCPTSGLPIDHVIQALLDLGLSRDDLRHLERLSDVEVLRRLPVERRNLDQRQRRDVVVYLRTWADLLEEEWMATVEVPSAIRGTGEPATATGRDFTSSSHARTRPRQ